MDEIERLYKMELPVLVGTVSVDVSETLARMLKRRGIPHNVLNAKYHQQEAEIVAHAGRPGAVTIATNMAGRGTDIKLGPGVTLPRTLAWLNGKGIPTADVANVQDPALAFDADKLTDDDAVDVGGLHIIGSERHESRRIDRQLRGRAGRQGDPGATQFFLSLEDDLMRLFNSDRVAGIMERLGAQEGEVITHPLVTRSIGSAQKRVEMQNFEARKRLLEYDDVMNQQREVIYDLRLFALEGGEDLKGEIWEMIDHALKAVVAEYAPDDVRPEEWDLAALRTKLGLDYFLFVEELPQTQDADHELGRDDVERVVFDRARTQFHRKLESFGEHRERVLSSILLNVIDQKWRDHLYDLDHLKASIGFRSWGQKDPLVEYKQEAYSMFVDLMADIRKTVAEITFRAQLSIQGPTPPPMPRRVTLSGPSELDGAGRIGAAAVKPAVQEPEPDALEAAFAGAARRTTTSAMGSTAPELSRLQTNRGDDGAASARPVSVEKTPGRNDPCWCGSGKKFKKCHGA
jgi:preprotein translocase subunit SecA